MIPTYNAICEDDADAFIAIMEEIIPLDTLGRFYRSLSLSFNPQPNPPQFVSTGDAGSKPHTPMPSRGGFMLSVSQHGRMYLWLYAP